MKPVFLSMEEILEIHADQITRYGGASGIRDQGLLHSAVMTPMSGAGKKYFYKDIFEMAAAYLFHIISNHPFVDGNKRVGAVAAYVFLELNGRTLNVDESEFEEIVMSVARGKTDKKTVAQFFRKNFVK